MYYKMWIYGRPFSGKTHFATGFPKPFVISTDGNAQFFTDDYIQVDTLEEYAEALDKFINEPNDYETLIIDVAEHVYEMVRTYYLDKQGIKYEGDANDHGKTWKMVRLGFIETFAPIRKIKDKHVILISHENERIVKDNLGREVSYFEPMIDDTKENIHGRISGLMHFVGRVYTEDKKVKGGREVVHSLSFGHNGGELSGVRVPIKDTKIENTYEAFIENIKEAK